MSLQRIQRIFPKNLPAAIGPYTPVTAVGNLLYVSGQIPAVPQSGKIQVQDIEGQTHQVMKNLQSALEGAGSSFDHVVKTTVLLRDMAFFPKVNAVYGSYFKQGQYPARACYAVVGLPRDALVEIEAIAIKKE